MSNFTPDRRSLLKGGGTLLAAAATMSSEQLLGYAKAWAQTAQWKPEAGAKINMLRWKRFVEAEDDRVHEDRRCLPEGNRRDHQRIQQIL